MRHNRTRCLQPVFRPKVSFSHVAAQQSLEREKLHDDPEKKAATEQGFPAINTLPSACLIATYMVSIQVIKI